MSGNSHTAATAITVIERLRSIIAAIQDQRLTTPLNRLRRWHVDLDLAPVPRDVVENTSDLLRKAAAHLDLPPARREVAVKAVQEALSLWQPIGGGAREGPRANAGSDDTLDPSSS